MRFVSIPFYALDETDLDLIIRKLMVVKRDCEAEEDMGPDPVLDEAINAIASEIKDRVGSIYILEEDGSITVEVVSPVEH